METKRILIVDDHPTLREGLRSLLSSQDVFDIVGEAGDGLEAVALVDKLRPDLVLMDISMPRMDGIAATREIKGKRPETKILIFSVYMTPEYLKAALEAGADGYILKDSPRTKLILSIKNILAGNQVISLDSTE
ncbi:MAG: response regulator transcription factor [Thermodesulfobacteriota bacterium]